MFLNEKKDFNQTNDDCVKDFCKCEKADEEYIRLLKKQSRKIGSYTMEKRQFRQRKILLYILMILLLLIYQELVGKVGRIVADLIPYERFDPFNAFAWVSVHHITEMVITLVVIMILSKILTVDFALGFGDRKKGIKYVVVFTVIFTGITIVCHILMQIYNMLPVYNYPLDTANILGTLGFQLFLSGPAEEILYRALPITMLVFMLGKNTKVKRNITLEIIIASFLFAIAHAKWSLFPFSFEANYFQLFYAFVLGNIMGKVYHETHSIVYPMLIHSISNVLMVGTGYLFLLLC